jgi:HD-GYP domain-containing protein (c-di-GMP phosphodiesterase class II)
VVRPVRRLREVVAVGDPVLFIARHSLYLGSKLLPRESLSLYKLIEVFERAEVESVEFLPAVSDEDVDFLVRMIVGEPNPEGTPAGLAINRTKPTLDDSDERALDELRRSYGVGLELLRQTASAVAMGRPVDLDAATRLVRQLTDQVIQDPAHALLLTTVRSYDEYTYYHMLNVCLLSVALGYAVGLGPDQIVALGIGALLHDVGKVNVPIDILQQVGALSAEQWRLIQRHPVDGAGLIFATGGDLLSVTAAIVLEHHAAYDLSGYPQLSGRPTPSLPARMVAVADCFDAMTTQRPYRKAEERRQALNIMLAGTGRGFDPHVIRAFVRLLGVFPVGSLIRLTNGSVGVVTQNHPKILSRPTVRLLLDSTGSPCEPVYVDLAERRPDGTFRIGVERSMDPEELGVDVMAVLLTGQLEEAKDREPGPSLVHEPSFGEVPPPGYHPLDDDHMPAG